MTDSNQEELSPDDWNYRRDERIDPSKTESIASISSIGLGIVLSFWLTSTGNPVLALLVLAIGFGLPLFLTEGGQVMLKDAQRNYNEGKENSLSQQQEQQSGTSKQVCSECGWQNPRQNQYCHDCGVQLSS